MAVHIKHELVVFRWALHCTLNTLLSWKYYQNLQYTPRDRKARSRAKKFMCLRSAHPKCLWYLRACGYYYDNIAPLYSWWARKQRAPWPSESRLSFTSCVVIFAKVNFWGNVYCKKDRSHSKRRPTDSWCILVDFVIEKESKLAQTVTDCHEFI